MASEAPELVIALVVIVSVLEVDHLNAALIVKSVHRIQPLAKAARWHGDFHDKRKVAGDGLAAWPAFVTAGQSCSLRRGRRAGVDTALNFVFPFRPERRSITGGAERNCIPHFLWMLACSIAFIWPFNCAN